MLPDAPPLGVRFDSYALRHFMHSIIIIMMLVRRHLNLMKGDIMSKKLSVSIETPVFCSYDNIWKISWKIGGRRTNAFSTRGKHINIKVSEAVKKAEYY